MTSKEEPIFSLSAGFKSRISKATLIAAAASEPEANERGSSLESAEDYIMHLSLETPTTHPHPGETWGIRQLTGKKEEKAPP